MINWLRPAKRSARVSLPLGPSNRYCFSTFSQGSSRRCRLRSSRSLVNSFSLRSNSLRRAIHCCGETTSCRLISVLVVRVVMGFLLVRRLNRRGVVNERVIRMWSSDPHRKADADQFRAELTERIKTFHRVLHPEKTRRLEFGPYALDDRHTVGERKPETGNRKRPTSWALRTSA